MDTIEFIAQVKEVKARALVSLDKSYRVLLECEDQAVMDLGKWPADETVRVRIERNKG